MTIRKRTDHWLIFGRTARIISIFGKGKHCSTSVTNWYICTILKKKNSPETSYIFISAGRGEYLQVNALSELLSGFDRETSILGLPSAVLTIPSSLFVNDNSRAMSSSTFLLFKLNTLHKETVH